jgi:outer membrane protein OmpA-like peptidoglycan-associated protein
MRDLVIIIIVSALTACGGAQAGSAPAAESGPDSTAPASSGSEAEPASAAATQPTADGAAPASNEFVVRESDHDPAAQASKPSKIKATATEAALKLFVVDKDKGPIAGIVIALTASDGAKYYTAETDADGYTELLVPVGKSYDLVYLSLGRRDIAAKVTVSDKRKQNIRLTMRYQRIDPPKDAAAPRFVLDGVYFDSGKAVIRPESFARLDSVVEYMTHKKSARIEISGHTDNVGNPKQNKALSQKRVQACRDYLVSKGIDGDRIVATGYGDERPIASNDTEEGRQKNRRIEATEL